MKRIIVFGIAVFLASCTEDQLAAPGDAGTAVVAASASAAVVQVAAKTATVAAAAVAGIDAKDDPEDEPEDEPVAGACAVNIPWSSISRCTSSGYVYAVGVLEGVRELSLARAGAADRARREVFGKNKGTVSGAEVLEFSRCGKKSFALSRAPTMAVAPETKECDAKISQHAAPHTGCPAWTVTVARVDKDVITAVGVARMKNSALAESTAINRARAEIARVVSTRVSKEDAHGHSHASDGGGAFSELGRKKVVCGGNTFVELTAKSMN